MSTNPAQNEGKLDDVEREDPRDGNDGERPEPVLAVGASGDPKNPEAGAPMYRAVQPDEVEGPGADGAGEAPREGEQPFPDGSLPEQPAHQPEPAVPGQPPVPTPGSGLPEFPMPGQQPPANQNESEEKQ